MNHVTVMQFLVFPECNKQNISYRITIHSNSSTKVALEKLLKQCIIMYLFVVKLTPDSLKNTFLLLKLH